MNILQDINDLFVMLHDGTIVRAIDNNSNIELKVNIQYLAELINKDFEYLFVNLRNVQNLSFEAWTDEPLTIINPKEIFNLELAILSTEITETGNLIVHCSCFNSINNLFSGGKLIFKCDDFEIMDEAHQSITLDKLKELTTHYWDDIFGKK